MVSKSAPFHERTNLGPYMFFDVTDGREHHGKSSGSLSVYNEPEAEAAVEILKVLRRRCVHFLFAKENYLYSTGVMSLIIHS